MTTLLEAARAALNDLEAVLCDPEGRAGIRGSDADNAIIDTALDALRTALAAAEQPAEPVGWRHRERVNGEFDTDWILTKSEPPEGVRIIAKEPLYSSPAAPAEQPVEPAGWVCPECGADRCKTPCPKGHSAALTGDCPMAGTAIEAARAALGEVREC